MKKRLQALRNEEGLTLVELLAVIVILAIIAVIAFVMIGQVIENSKKDAHISNAQQLISSAKLYQASGGEIDETAGVGGAALNTAGVIDKIVDPWAKLDTGDQGTVFYDKATGIYTVLLAATDTTDCAPGIVATTTEMDLGKKDARKTLCG